MDDPELKLVIGILVAVVLAALGWYFWDDLTGSPEPAISPPVSLPQEGVSPGQAAVFYDRETGDRVLGGGWIRSTRSSHA